MSVKPHSSSTVVKNEPLVRIMSTWTVRLSLRRKSPLAVLAGLKGTSHSPLNSRVFAITIAADWTSSVNINVKNSKQSIMSQIAQLLIGASDIRLELR
jgi:hypothetical protein